MACRMVVTGTRLPLHNMALATASHTCASLVHECETGRGASANLHSTCKECGVTTGFLSCASSPHDSTCATKGRCQGQISRAGVQHGHATQTIHVKHRPRKLQRLKLHTCLRGRRFPGPQSIGSAFGLQRCSGTGHAQLPPRLPLVLGHSQAIRQRHVPLRNNIANHTEKFFRRCARQGWEMDTNVGINCCEHTCTH